MRSDRKGGRRHSRGAQLAMTALLMPVLVGVVALTVDTGVKAVAIAQLRTVADSAALAGVVALASENRLKPATQSIPNELAAATAASLAAGRANSVLNKPAVMINDSSSSDGNQVRVGFLSPSDVTSTSVNTAVSQTLFNSVEAMARLDGGHGGLVPAYFSKLWGNPGSSASAKAIATIENYDVSAFKSVNGQRVGLLPIVLDKDTYNAMIAGTTTDQYSYTPPSAGGAGYGTVASGSDGVPESKLYPVATGNPGNWGTVKIGVSNNSTSTLGDQIRYGITPSQLATFPNGQITLDKLDNSTSPPTPYTNFGGNPGISAGIKDDLISIIGRPSWIPIYDQSSGNGNNASFRIIKFAAVRVLAVNFTGNPKYVIVQPALINDASAVPDTKSSPPWTSGGVLRIFLAR